jgi:hypothetical protein
MKKILLLTVVALSITSVNAQIKVLSNGKVGINCSSPLEQLQIGDRFTFHNGSVKLLGYNHYWDGSNSKRIVADQVALLKFEPNGDIRFVFADSSSAGSTISSFTDGLWLKNNGNAVLGGIEYGKLSVTNSSTVITSYANHSFDYGYGVLSKVDRNRTKAFAIISSLEPLVDQYTVDGRGNVWARSVTSYSDLSLKENIEEIDSPLQKVLQLNGIYYTFKVPELSVESELNTGNSDEAPKRCMGFIAQEVEETVPEVVNTNENGLKGIEYQNLVALLVEAIKELEVQVATLENEVDNCCNSFDIQNKNTEIDDNESNLNGCYLIQNRPNPFNQETVISYSVPIKRAHASILFFDMNGKLITSKVIDTDKKSIIISSTEFMPGMYFYSLIVNGEEVDTKKMILTE